MARPPQGKQGKGKTSAPYLKPSKRVKSSKAALSAQAKGKGKATDTDLQADATTINGRPKRRPDQPKKVKLRDQKVIPVPQSNFAGIGGSSRRAPLRGEGDIDGGDDESDVDEEGEEELEDDDLGAEEGLGTGFLAGLDRNALSRSLKETERIHRLEKINQQMPSKKRDKLKIPLPDDADDLSDYDIDSEDDLDLEDDVGMAESGMDDDGPDEDEDEDDLGASGLDDEDNDASLDSEDDDESEGEDSDDETPVPRKRKGKGKEEEADYERSGRSKVRWAESSDNEEDEAEVGRLPIKLPTGEVQQVAGTTRIPLPASKKRKKPEPESEDEVEPDEEDDEDESDGEAATLRMAAQKGKFGRMGVAEIVAKEDWKNARKLEAAKEQIAALGAEILAGGELVDTIPTLTRLSTFALAEVPSPSTTKPIPVPNSIRGLAILSLLAVYKDLVPGYRVRQLTEQEEAEKVRDEVKRLREGEKGLVRTYKEYLKTLEADIKRKSALADLSIRCMCELLSSITHFNFSENIMGVLVGKIGKRSWDENSNLILHTFITVFQSDLTSLYSQTLVRLLARMIKERKFQVHPNVLSCLLHLRLHSELDQMRANKKDLQKKAKGKWKGKKQGKGGGVTEGETGEKQFKSDVRKKWATKNQKKREKEEKEARKEMKEAEAEVDKEERAQVQTEILKNLFVLYFSILKHQARTPLLPAALEGITHFGHFINIEFFRDLLEILRRIVLDQHESKVTTSIDGDDDATTAEDAVSDSERVRTRLLAIATAFEILSGQGEALNIDLSEFINALFVLLRPLSLDVGLEDPPTSAISLSLLPKQSSKETLTAGRAPPKARALSLHVLSTSGLMLRCLHAIFFNKYTTQPPWRTAAFLKRLTESALLFPPSTARSVLDLVASLMSRDAKLEGLVDTEERMYDGTYRPEMDDPQLVNTFSSSMWEITLLEKGYWEKGVREAAKKIGEGNPNATANGRT